ncbi:MAG: hypothetical protein EOP56_05750 [Sphingobacteriales bacterium]|nr:MAG: hypothetical protein EOP56_05750 [Sphingobacteriales bacterium]
MEQILRAVNLYAEGAKKVEQRRDDWVKKMPELKQQLKSIAKYLSENADYKPGFYVDTLYAYDEESNGICRRMPSLAFRSGPMPLFVDFDKDGQRTKTYTENGFQIMFSPIITGQVLVTLFYHSNALIDASEKAKDMMLIDNPAAISKELIDAIIENGIEAAFYSSYTGIAEQKETSYTPIGFKTQRAETTEHDMAEISSPNFSR